MMGNVLLTTKRWRLPFGNLTIGPTLSAALTVAVHEDFQLIIIALLTGLAADLLTQYPEPNQASDERFRLFAWAMLAVLYIVYFGVLAASERMWWSVHMWAGAIVIAGAAGWLLGYAFMALDPRG